ncbi:hypothetical protein HDU76_006419 [Blyttiomyces sp. JEL0837]|nr:hypothetical protein HDU76_006419 [Blyttiomyces sp. JEL0837]
MTTPFPAVFTNHTRFTLDTQNCDKLGTHKDHAPAATPHRSDPSLPRFDNHNQETTTVIQVVTATATGPGGAAVATPTNDQSEAAANSSSSTKIILFVVGGGGPLLLILGLAWYLRRRQRPEMEKKNKYLHDEFSERKKNIDHKISDIDEATVKIDNNSTPADPTKAKVSSPHQYQTDDDHQEPVLITVWLREVDPDVQRQQFWNNLDSEVIGTQETQQQTMEPTPGPTDQSLPKERLGRNKRNTRIAHPSLQLSRYEQAVREVAPTSNTDLEIHLQRSYGLFHTWNHSLVMEWARLKDLDPAIVDIMKDFHIDGALLATLDVHSLKEKCHVQEFRLRAKFIQAVEFLKDSRNTLSTFMDNDASGSLPRYQRDSENDTSENEFVLI